MVSMGAVPKKKPSKTRTRQRHQAWENNQISASQITLIKCTNCEAEKMSHRVCPECGFYHSREVIEPKAKVKRVST